MSLSWVSADKATRTITVRSGPNMRMWSVCGARAARTCARVLCLLLHPPDSVPLRRGLEAPLTRIQTPPQPRREHGARSPVVGSAGSGVKRVGPDDSHPANTNTTSPGGKRWWAAESRPSPARPPAAERRRRPRWPARSRTRKNGLGPQSIHLKNKRKNQ